MATITRTTAPLDAEIILPGVTYTNVESVYKSWYDTFVSSNPIEAQISFFKDLATKVKSGEITIEFYHYWYEKVKSSHPVVVENLPVSDTPEWQDINESVGVLYFAQPNIATTAISNIASTTLDPIPGNTNTLLPTDLFDNLETGYNTVNTSFATNIANIQTNPSAVPTSSHGVSLVKDTIANTRNTSSLTLIKSTLEQTYDTILGLTEIENTITGDIAIEQGQYTSTIEGITILVDDLTNKIDPTTSNLSNTNLQAS